MKIVNGRVELTEKERMALIRANDTISCGEIECCDCPFEYNCGCILETLRQITENN